MKQFYAKYNKKLNINAETLRKNMTEQERKLWYLFLKDYPVRILRQKIINNSILDFYCAKAKLGIEIDGSQHYTTEGIIHDKERTAIIESEGIEIIRFSNMDINKHFKSVCEYIDNEINKRMSKKEQ